MHIFVHWFKIQYVKHFKIWAYSKGIINQLVYLLTRHDNIYEDLISHIYIYYRYFGITYDHVQPKYCTVTYFTKGQNKLYLWQPWSIMCTLFNLYYVLPGHKVILYSPYAAHLCDLISWYGIMCLWSKVTWERGS